MRSEWTAVIPAAGKGSRLGYDKPKLLYPVAGKTIAEHLVAKLTPFCSRIVFVTSRGGLAPISDYIQATSALRNAQATFAFSYQIHTLGMADAVRTGVNRVGTSKTLILWGDQIAVNPGTIGTCIAKHENVTVPVVLNMPSPYIHFGERVLQAREGDKMPPVGDSDIGMFLFNTDLLRVWMPAYLTSKKAVGAKTGELNFLPLFDLLHYADVPIKYLPVASPLEALGVNTVEDAQRIEKEWGYEQD